MGRVALLKAAFKNSRRHGRLRVFDLDPILCDPLHMRNAADGHMCHSWTLRIVGITMNQNVPFIWRVNYRNEAASPETFLEIAHERARQYLRKNLSSMSVHKAV